MAVDYFLKFSETIMGESKNSAFKDAMQIQSFGWGASQTSTVSGTGGSGAGKASFSDFNFSMDMDTSTGTLLAGLCEGKHYGEAVLSAVKAGAKNNPYMTLKITQVFVASVSISASSEVPSVSVSLTFGTFDYQYKIQGTDGNLVTGSTAQWSVVKNEEK